MRLSDSVRSMVGNTRVGIPLLTNDSCRRAGCKSPISLLLHRCWFPGRIIHRINNLAQLDILSRGCWAMRPISAPAAPALIRLDSSNGKKRVLGRNSWKTVLSFAMIQLNSRSPNRPLPADRCLPFLDGQSGSHLWKSFLCPGGIRSLWAKADPAVWQLSALQG